MFLLYIILLSSCIFQESFQETIQTLDWLMCQVPKNCQRTRDIQLLCTYFIAIKRSVKGSIGFHETKTVSDGNTRPSPRLDKKTTKHKKGMVFCPEFMHACEVGDLVEVKRQVAQGQDINCRNDELEDCVMAAAFINHDKMFDFLLHHGCDLSAVDEDNCDVLHHACIGGSIYIVKRLVDDYKCDMEWRSTDRHTPLLHASNFAVVKFLKDRGADIKARNKANNTILHIACKKGLEDVVKYVLSQNIFDLECRGEVGRTPLMLAIQNGRGGLVDILQGLHGASITATDLVGSNVFHIACAAGDLEMVKYLFTLGELRGFERMKDIFGNTPLQSARKNGKAHIVSFLESQVLNT